VGLGAEGRSLGLFWMLTLVAYGAYARKPCVSRYSAVLCSFALGLLAKPMLVTLPVVLLLLDAWPLGRWAGPVGGTRRRLLAEKAPLLLLSALSAAVTVLAQSRGGSIGDLDAIPLPSRLANAAVSTVWYLGKTVWPSGLALVYPHPSIVFPERTAHLLGAGAAAAVALAAATVAAIRSRRERPHLAVGWTWYVVALMPVIGLVQVGTQSRADRYTYLPLIGIFLAGPSKRAVSSSGGPRSGSRWRRRASPFSRRWEAPRRSR